MILTAIYHMISTGETFNPCDLYKIDMPQDMRNAHREKAIRQAKQFLISQGIVDLIQSARFCRPDVKLLPWIFVSCAHFDQCRFIFHLTPSYHMFPIIFASCVDKDSQYLIEHLYSYYISKRYNRKPLLDTKSSLLDICYLQKLLKRIY
jgi:hypothetical protein